VTMAQVQNPVSMLLPCICQGVCSMWLLIILNMALSSCSTKWFFASESGDTNLHESLFFVVQNPFLDEEMDPAC
jgi:hypothetical protein